MPQSPRRTGLLLPILLLWAAPALAQVPEPRTFELPQRTTWTPEGCRAAPADVPALPARTTWRNLHADEVNTDEVQSALAPVFRADWIAEPGTYNTTGPVFDSEGNLYFSPLFPAEPVVLISVEPEEGTRRFAVPNTTGRGAGTGTPMVLADPDAPGEEIVYLGLYDRALAVRTDGSPVWDVATGLAGGGGFDQVAFGVNYLPQADALVGLTGDGFLYLLERRTGAPLLAEPFELPGAKSPPGPPSGLPPAVQALADARFRTLAQLPDGATLFDFVDVLLGNDVEVANFFSVEPRSGRIFVAATAPDEADGSVDGVSELGAIYGLDLVQEAGPPELEIACSRFFDGGSAATPSLRADGERLYVADNFGKLIALDRDCNDVWELDLGTQIFGSIGVSSDNGEVYASSAAGIVQVFDEGDEGVRGWTATIDVYDVPPGQQNVNLNLVGIGANAISFQAGAGPVLGTTFLPLRTGLGQLDRETGEVRWFADGLEETVAVQSIGPDGALYIGNSPVRRIFARVLSELGQLPPTPEIVGGIRKWRPERLDLLARDAACAAADRAANAFRVRRLCRASAAADAEQVGQLAAQARHAVVGAVLDGDVAWWEALRTGLRLGIAERLARVPTLRAAERQLTRACRATGG